MMKFTFRGNDFPPSEPIEWGGGLGVDGGKSQPNFISLKIFTHYGDRNAFKA